MAEIEAEIVKSVDEVDRSQWDNVVKQSRSGSRKQFSQFIKAIEKGTSGNPLHTVIRKKENIIGVMPGRLRNLPLRKKFLSTSKPVITSNKKDALEKLLSTVEKCCKEKNIVYHTILTSGTAGTPYNAYLEEQGYSSSIHSCRHTLDLNEKMENIVARMSTSRRKNFQKLYENGSIEVFKPSEDDLLEFYDRSQSFLNKTEVTDRGINYFLQLENMSGIRMASFKDSEGVVAQNLYLLDQENSTAYYLLSGVREDYREHKALETIHAHAIREFKDNFSLYDFGSNRADFRDGVFKFKDQYGSQTTPNLMWRRNFSTPGNRLYLKLLGLMRE
jgi:hypothetical protein